MILSTILFIVIGAHFLGWVGGILGFGISCFVFSAHSAPILTPSQEKTLDYLNKITGKDSESSSAPLP